MTNKSINIIAAVDSKFGFGKDGKIPWHIPEDFKFFMTKTLNSVVIMGKTTFDDLLTYSKNGKVLPNRQCIVLSSDTTLESSWDNVQYTNDVTDALFRAAEFQSDVYFIGGERVFRVGMNIADNVYLTHISNDYDCDRFFPSEKLSAFQLIDSRKSEVHSDVTYKTYTRMEWK